ncbi:MAG: glycosyltransferase family 4 protein [Actinomycetota bacterium]
MYLKNLLDALNGETLVVGPADERVDGPETGVVRGTRSYMLPDRATRRLVRDAGKDFEPDAILFGAPHPLSAMGPWLREELGVPFGVLSHGAEITIPGFVPGARQALGKVLRDADVRFAVSRFTARKVEALSHRPVEFLGAGVEIDTFTPPPAAPDNPVPVVGCVSRFVPRKGQDRLLRAAASLNRDVEVLFVGAGRTEGAIRKLAQDLGVKARFEIDVPWSELPGLYRSMDVFCMPCKSRWGGLEVEGLGLVFLEAASTAIPVLAGDSGGSPETVIPGETGFVVSSVSDITEGLEILLTDPVRAAEMGRKGREFVLREFTWERVVERLHGGFAPHIG